MNHAMLRSLLSTTLAAGLLAGCASGNPHPGQSASRAQSALGGGQTEKAVALAEQAVLADPRNSGYRMLLGSAYLRAGRFESARQAYDDAMELGDDSGKVALSLALTDIALGHQGVALDTLNAHRDQLGPADYGLALAMAGRAEQAVAVLGDAVRAGDASPKLRQNLAYALAMAGHWREAREMAAQDVPADQLAARMTQWAQLNDPSNTRMRVAGLLGVPLRGDEGQPTALALANFPATDGATGQATRQATAQAAQAPVQAQFAAQELPAIDSASGQPQVADASSAPPTEKLAAIDMPPSQTVPAPMLAPMLAQRPASDAPVLAPLLTRKPQPAPAFVARAAQVRAAQLQARVSAPVGGSHLVQLGAFATEEGARRAWRHYLAVMPGLKGYSPVITKASVNGKLYWRTQAAGFASADPAQSLCGSVKARGGVCMVLANPAQKGPQAVAMRLASNRR